jgi:hypothetical protein
MTQDWRIERKLGRPEQLEQGHVVEIKSAAGRQ